MYGYDIEASVIVRVALFEREASGRTHSAGKGLSSFFSFLLSFCIFELMDDCPLSAAARAHEG